MQSYWLFCIWMVLLFNMSDLVKAIRSVAKELRLGREANERKS